MIQLEKRDTVGGARCGENRTQLTKTPKMPTNENTVKSQVTTHWI